MKYPLIALTLLAAAPLSAGYHEEPNQYASEDNCYSCDPCCKPQPKKCIDCECYTPAFYDLQCACGVSLSVDFLYWYAKETNLDYAIERDLIYTGEFIGNSPAFVSKQDDIKTFGTDWEPGVRVGAGFNSSCDGWDVSATWSYMKNTRKDKSSGPDAQTFFEIFSNFPQPVGQEMQVLVSPWHYENFIAEESGVITSSHIPVWNTVSASWRLRFNQVDIELGRKYWLSPCFTLRPFTGLRGVWIDTRMKIKSELEGLEDFPDLNLFSSEDKITNENWGVGFLGGIQPNWYFSSCFSLYSNLEASLLWGMVRANVKETNLITGDDPDSGGPLSFSSAYKLKKDYALMLPTLDLGIGVRWERTWCCDRFRSALDLGWEHHVFFDYNHKSFKVSQSVSVASQDRFSSGFSISDTAFVERTGNLIMGGLVVRARFDF